MKIRYYQREGIDAFYDYLTRFKGNPIGAFPTGTGKSYILAAMLQEVLKWCPGQRMLVLTHVKELIQQNYDELVSLWPMAPAGIYSAGVGRKEVRPITFAGIQSVADKAALFGHVDLAYIDECHLVSHKEDTSYRDFLNDLKQINPRIRWIGLTATPYRLGQGLLTEPVNKDGKAVPPIFTDICYNITGLEAFNRLISEGYLAHLTPKKTATQMDVSEVKVSGGDFVQSALQDAVDKDELTYACIKETIEQAADRKHWLVFTTGIRHAEHVGAMLESCGVSCVVVHSKTPSKQRDEAVRRFKAGEVRALVNPVLYTVGFNHKPIDCIVDLAPTTSPSRHVQKYGRGTRPYDYRTERDLELARNCPEIKTDCLVLDFAGNVKRNGPINDPRIPKKKGVKTGLIADTGAPIKLCPICAVYNHSSVRFCTKCGEEFPPAVVNLTEQASTEEVIVGVEPVIEIKQITGVDYDRYKQRFSEKPPSLKVTFHWGGLRSVSVYQCFEHIGYPSKLARDWWREAANDSVTEPPKTIAEALTRLQEIRRPSHLKIWMNRQEPKVQAYDYSGSAFGTQLPPL